MRVEKSKKNHGKLGLVGHIGVGHIHSYKGYIQDDSAGFTVLAHLLKQAFPIDSSIKDIRVDREKDSLEIETGAGGLGRVYVRRGITIWEQEILKSAINKDSLYSQEIVLQTFGRIYGQGVFELATAFQGGLALALVDSFKKIYPQDFYIEDENIGDNIGKILGTVVDINTVATSVLLTINATRGGIGPVEDLEGNIFLGNKAKLMEKLKLNKLPTIVVESKNYFPGISNNLDKNYFYIRANYELDNNIVYQSLKRAAKEVGFPYKSDNKAFYRGDKSFIEANQKFADQIIEYGEQFKRVNSSKEKVDIISNLALLISQDAGGLSFMSNDLEKIVGPAGLLPGTSAVLSLLVSQDYIDYYKIPYVDSLDIEKYSKIVYKAIGYMDRDYNQAIKEVKNKYNFREEDFSSLIN